MRRPHSLLLAFALASTFANGQSLTLVIGKKKVVLDEKALHALPQITANLKEHDGSLSTYSGPSLSAVLARAGVPMGENVRGKALAAYVLVKASDGYEAVFGLGEVEPSLSGRNFVLGLTLKDKPLPSSLGPFRLVVEDDKRQARSVRMVTEVEVVLLKP